MNIPELQDIMCRLSSVRPLFHSEADFQHAFAWEVHGRYPNAQIRLEREALRGLYLDISVTVDHATTAIELKYAKQKLSLPLRGEEYALRTHGAQDVRRYDVLKDLVRIERLVSEGVASVGYIILLTNDASYWQPRPNPIRTTADAAFRLHQGRTLGGTMEWGSTTGPGTNRDRENPLTLVGEYVTDWIDYSCVAPPPAGIFRYLALEVRRERLTASMP